MAEHQHLEKDIIEEHKALGRELIQAMEINEQIQSGTIDPRDFQLSWMIGKLAELRCALRSMGYEDLKELL